MRRVMFRCSATLVLGLGLAVALLWGLGCLIRPVVAAPGDVITVCMGGGCDYDSVQAAVDAATGGEVIKIATGVYTGVQVRPASSGYPGSPVITQVVYISAPLVIRGGYTTANGFSDPPDPVANPSVLDAQYAGRVVYVAEDVTVTLEGLALVHGDASGQGGGASPSYLDSGGGAYTDRATVTISGCQVATNRATSAGGIFVNHGTFGIQDSVITSNVAITANGGGLYIYASSKTVISQTTVSSNTAGFNGGGLYLVTYDVTDALVCESTIVSNTASSSGGGIFMASAATLVNNAVVGNRSGGTGGGLHINGRSPTVVSNRVFGNHSDTFGGGIYASGDRSTFQANLVISNAAESSGGGLLLRDSEGRFENNIVARNRVAAGRSGAGAYFYGGSPVFVYTTFAQNVGGDGSGLYLRELTGAYSTVLLTNTILVSHAVGVYVEPDNAAILTATLWGEDEWSNGVDWAGGGTILTGTINVGGDPSFVHPDNMDYHLGAGSAAIDQAVSTTVNVDIDGDTRPVGPLADLGADEYVVRTYLPLVLRE
jgi:parallel beta-helix repeat protein/predicted outer membrane repeat protein